MPNAWMAPIDFAQASSAPKPLLLAGMVVVARWTPAPLIAAAA